MNIKYTSQFKKDYKKNQKQNKNIEKLKILIEELSREKTLDEHYQDHPLSGKWKNYRECHIAPDWLENSGHFGHPFRVIPDSGIFPLFTFR